MAKHSHLLAIDLGEVLLSVDHTRTYRQLAQFCDLSPGEVQMKLDDQPIIHALDRGEMNPAHFAAAVSDALGCTIDVETLRRYWTGILGVKHDVASWLETVMPQVTCVLVSNINWWHWQEAQELLPLLKQFDAHVLSYVEGVRKPEAEYYRRVRNRWAMSNALFIDDRLDNCDAARAHGFTAWQFMELRPLAKYVKTWLA